MGHHTQDEMLLCSDELLVVHCPCHPERSSRTLSIGAFVQRKLARLPIRWPTRKPARSCGALPTTTTVLPGLPSNNSPIRKKERLATDASTAALQSRTDNLMTFVGW